MSNGASVKVDLGISECIRTIDSIKARKAERRESFLDDLCDDVDAVEEVVKTFDNLFIELVRGFGDKHIADNPASLEAHMEHTMTYLKGRDLLPVLEDLIGGISGIASDKRLRRRVYRDLVSTLRDLEKRLNSFREQLGKGSITGVGQTNELNLMLLLKQLIPRLLQPFKKKVPGEIYKI
jgi:hypothetical protein